MIHVVPRLYENNEDDTMHYLILQVKDFGSEGTRVYHFQPANFVEVAVTR